AEIGKLITDQLDDPALPLVALAPALSTQAQSAATTTTTAASVFANFASGSQNVTLSATVTGSSGAVDAGTVTFIVLNGSTIIGTPLVSQVSNGSASGSFKLPAGLADGVYTIKARYGGAASFIGSSDDAHVLGVGAITTTSAPDATASFAT